MQKRNLQLIENKLKVINQADFQELCDRLLFCKYPDYSRFSRIGSQSGKQKTIKGTPDSLIRMPNGKYILIEYSTNISQGESKLEDDVRKCLDPKRTAISVEDIEEIIICTNFRVKTSEEQQLRALLPEDNITLTFYDLDSLSLELCINHRNLASEFLGLSLDTGQVVSMQQFIQEYDRASGGIAAPLDNRFFYREKELQDLLQEISAKDWVVLYGAPGAGKTRLALETIKRFVQENPSFASYCISYKNTSLIEDLSLYLNSEKDYILLVDDANRINDFSQIIGFYSALRSGKLKFLVTVRDYAYEEVKNICSELPLSEYELKKLTNEQIVDIIKEKPLGILNYQYQKKIVDIADGNPRLAIMAALLAKEKQNLEALNNVSDLFETYYRTFVRDCAELTEEFNIKVLGLIAFFNALPYRDKDRMIGILQHFHLDYAAFIDSIERMNRLELVAVRYDYVKIQEQNLALFFFYKAFIREALLSFETLVNQYFETYTARFRDCIIPVNNLLGYQKIREAVQPVLKGYWRRISGDEKKEMKLFSNFWFYMQEETLDFLWDIVERLPECEVSSYNMDYDENKAALMRNDVLDVLNKFFHYPFDSLKDALEISLEYCRKLPQCLPILLDRIKKELAFNDEDRYCRFARQNILFDLLIKGLRQGDKLYSKVFFNLAGTFLAFRFQNWTAGINRYSVSLGFYDLPDHNAEICMFREKLWKQVDEYFSEDAFALLEKYLQVGPDVVKGIMKYDLPFMVLIIEKHLDPDNFSHCCYVHKLIRHFHHFKVVDSCLDHLSEKFTNDLYEFFLKFRWDMMGDKEIFEYNNYDKYKKLKEAEIRKYFVFTQKSEIEEFCDRLVYLGEVDRDFRRERFYDSLDIVVDENLNRNFDLGCQLLRMLAERKLCFKYIPDLAFRNHLTKKENVTQIWNLIQHYIPGSERASWEMSFYLHLADGLITDEYLQAIRGTVVHLNNRGIFLCYVSRFAQKDPTLLEDLLRIVWNRNERDGAKIGVWYDVLKMYVEQPEIDLRLAEQVYIQQKRLKGSFDYKKEVLEDILKRDIHFLVAYINELIVSRSKNVDGIKTDDELRVVWKYEGIEPVLDEIFDLFSRKTIYNGLSEHFCNSFFNKLKEQEYNKAKQFLLDFCRRNYADCEKMNIVVDITKNAMKELYREVLSLFISLTQNADLFSKIYWSEMSAYYSGDVISSMKATEWKRILEIVSASSVGSKLRPIKRLIKSYLDAYEEQAEREKKSRFIAQE